MNQRMPRTAAAGLFAALVINGSLWLTVDSTNSALAAAEPAAAVETPAETPADEARLLEAVRQAGAATVKAFNAADASALAGMFDAEGELVDETGNVFTGRDEVGKLFTAFFERFPEATLEMEVIDVRPLGEDLAVEEGARRITTPDGGVAEVQYTAVRARHGEAWPMISYREFSADLPPSPQEMLEPLAWLVGEWVDESPEGRTTIRYDWSESGNFLEGEYQLAVEGRPVGKTTQRIGWDPIQGAVRSWTFDPDGGFSEGLWLPTDEGWVIRSEATMSDGATGLATVTLRVRDQDHFVIESSDRIVAGMAEPDFTLVIARKPPAPAAPGAGDTEDVEDADD
jgi:uncharacterized protein (TIGR02246 family)